MSIYVTSRASMINRFKHKIKVINESGKTVHVTLREPRYQTIIYMKEELINYQYITVSYYDTLKIQIYYKNKEIFHGYLNEGEILTIHDVDESDEYEPRRLEIYNNLKKNQKRDLYIIFIIYVIFFIIIYSNKDKI
tara:strand:+ start:37 stop:444 length:408 start_codon:yes stop_codon:yes gene_type:complete